MKTRFVAVIIAFLGLILVYLNPGINSGYEPWRHLSTLVPPIAQCDFEPAVVDDTPLDSVLVSDVYVFASSGTGLYRASLVDRKWERIQCSNPLPANGYLSYRSRQTQPILYNTASGLYSSSDDGRTWYFVSGEHGLYAVFLHANGYLYALAQVRIEPPAPTGNVVDVPWQVIEPNGDQYYIRDIVLMSRDFGRTWQDITGDIGAGVELYSIFEDPDHPGRVALTGNSIRSYVLQASDERYHWKMYREWDWRKTHAALETDEDFFYRDYSSGSVFYDFPATLANYFLYDFGVHLRLPAFTIVPDRGLYEFALTDNKIVRVAIRFLPDKPTIKLVDVRDELDLWGIRVIDPQGRRTYVQPALAQLMVDASDRDHLAMIYRSRPDFQRLDVNSLQPYTRTIDISKLYDFSATGTYQVQLIYDTSSLPDSNRGEWIGSFAGEVFTVKIE